MTFFLGLATVAMEACDMSEEVYQFAGLLACIDLSTSLRTAFVSGP